MSNVARITAVIVLYQDMRPKLSYHLVTQKAIDERDRVGNLVY